jgi:hypothetical protein
MADYNRYQSLIVDELYENILQTLEITSSDLTVYNRKHLVSIIEDKVKETFELGFESGYDTCAEEYKEMED